MAILTRAQLNKLLGIDSESAKEWEDAVVPLTPPDGISKRVPDNPLELAKSLEGATMPDGQILKSDDNPDGPTFEDWIKSKGRGEE